MADATLIALLRGINVGGNNKLPMAGLATLFREAGCSDVRTYIQSGNVICKAGTHVADGLDARIAGAIEERFGLRVPVVLLTADEVAEAVRGNPFIAESGDERALHVAFLAHAPDAQSVAKLDPMRSPPDRFAVRGRAVYLHLPNGVARTRLTNAYLDSTLRTVSTLRNWRTVLTLLEMTRG
jgi:uncharacterized protein (DUF1697 family)